MADWPAGPVLGDSQTGVISTSGMSSLGRQLAGTGVNTMAWSAANLAVFVPFRLSEIVTVYQMACGTGTATTGNFDLGIYDIGGNRLVSSGSTAKTTATSERIVNTADTVLYPGMYYLAMAVDTNAAAYVGTAANAVANVQLAGLREMASAFPLPSTATYASMTTGPNCPLIAAFLRAD